MTPAPTPNKTEKKASPLATLLAYIQRQWHLLSIVARWMRLMLTKDNLRAYLRRHWRLLALLILYIFFRPTFEEKLGSMLQHFDPSWGSFIVWLGVIGILIALVCTHSLGYEWYLFSQKYSKSFVAILFGLWAYYHWGKVENYEIIPTPISGVYYMDIFLVLCACLLIVRVRSYREERARQRALRARMRQAPIDAIKEGYQIDQPITPEDEDLLGRRGEAESLAEKIFKTDTSKGAFTLGLTAPWGAGKTSFMLVMREYLRKKPSQEVIVMAFNPWMYRKAPNLTQVFFEELSRTLAPYNSDLASAFIRYVRSLLAQESNAWLQLVGRLLPQESNEKSITEQYDSLSQEICRLGRKIFIFIDDVDRLESEEIIELFCLVRNISSFPSMSYVLAYDKVYVISQLKRKDFDEQTVSYMEKILQEEYPLTKITPEQLEKAFMDDLTKLGPMYATLANRIRSSIAIVDYLPTIRAVKRIRNTLLSVRKKLEGNIDLFDWFIFELIRIQYPRLYDDLRERFWEKVNVKDEVHVILKYEKVEQYLSDNKKEFIIARVDLPLHLMWVLWGIGRRVEYGQANHKSCVNRYFYGTLLGGEIDESEFQRYIGLPFEELKQYVNQKLKNMQGEDFYHKIRRERIDSKEKIERSLLVAFYVDSFRLFFSNKEIDGLIRELKEYIVDEGQLKVKLEEVFSRTDIQVGVLLYLSMSTMDVEDEEGAYPMPFSPRELRNIKEDIFLRYVEMKNPFDPIACYLLWRECRSYYYERSDDEFGFPQQAISAVCHHRMDKEMKAIIEKHVEQLIPYFVRPYRSGYKLLPPDPIWDIDRGGPTSSIGYFPDFILKLDGSSSPIIKEFQAFLRSWIKIEEDMRMEGEEGGPACIGFKFKDIAPSGIAPILRVEDYA